MKGNDIVISCAIVVSVSASCSRHLSLAFSLLTMTYSPYGLWTISSCTIHIYSIDTILYLYALPLITSPLFFSSLCLSAIWALQVKIIIFGKVSTSSSCKRDVVEYSTDNIRQTYCWMKLGRVIARQNTCSVNYKEEPRWVPEEWMI